MRYVEAREFGGPEKAVVRERETPAPGPNEVLIEVAAIGVNYLDVPIIAGLFPGMSTLPLRPGFEAVGRVTRVGANVKQRKVGDAVGAIVHGGGYASHIVLPEDVVIPLPESLDLVTAAAVLVQGLTAFLLLERTAVAEGDVVLVSSAAGGLGLLATQIALMKKARVVGLASAEKHALVRNNGAEAVFDYREAGWARQVTRATGGADVYLDAIGDWGSEAFEALKPKGRWITYGFRHANTTGLRPEAVADFVEKNIALQGFNMDGYASDIPRALAQVLTWTATGALKPQVQTHPLAEVSAALHQLAARRTTGKLVLVP